MTLGRFVWHVFEHAEHSAYQVCGVLSTVGLRKVDLSCIESLLDLYSIMVDCGRFSTFRRVSRICSLSFASPSTLFQMVTTSSLCLTLIVHPQICGHSVMLSEPSSDLPLDAILDFELSSVLLLRQSSNWSPIMAKTRSSHKRSAIPFFNRMIHFPPERFNGSSHTGRRMPVWNRR